MKRMTVLAVVLLACAGCRSDGGFGRSDREHSFDFAMGTLTDRANYNARRTMYLLRTAPGRFTDSFAQSARELRSTYELYLDAHATR